MSWIAAAIAGSAAIGAGASMYSASKYKGSGQRGGYDVVQMPQYSFTEPRLRLTSDYLSQNIERMGRGEYPAWYDKASPVMRQGMMRGLNQAMYGKPGERTGVTQQAMDTGAQLGVGPKAAWSQSRKLYGDYLDKTSQIDEYLTSLGVNIMQTGEQTYLNASNQMPTGPNSQIVGGQGGAYGNQGGSPWGDFASTMAGNIDWGSLMQGGNQGMQGYQGTFGNFGNQWKPSTNQNLIPYSVNNSPAWTGPSVSQMPNQGWGNMVSSQYL